MATALSGIEAAAPASPAPFKNPRRLHWEVCFLGHLGPPFPFGCRLIVNGVVREY
jgi:hypothetical protein